MKAKSDIGLVGLAVMGENLVLNMESKGFQVSVFNRTVEKVDRFISGRGAGKNIIGTPEAWSGYDLDYSKAGARCETVEEFVAAIGAFCSSPRPRFNAYSRHVFLEKYSADCMVDKFRKVLE